MEPGELYVLSDATFATYYKDPEKYEKGKRGDFMTVGDIAYMDDEGFFYICDRKNDMIISGGVNIYPAEIEAVLVAHPDIADAAVFGIPDEEWGEAVHAVITTYDGQRRRPRPRSRRSAASTWPVTRCRAPTRRWPRSRAAPRARSSSANCASRTGRAAPPASARYPVFLTKDQIRNALTTCINDAAAQGVDDAGLHDDLAAVPDSFDALYDSPSTWRRGRCRADWPFVEPLDFDGDTCRVVA